MRQVFLPVFLLFSLSLSSCASTSSLDRVRGSADKRVAKEIFSYGKEEVFMAAKNAVLDATLKIQTSDQVKGEIYAKSEPKFTRIVLTRSGYGELVGVYVTPIEDNQTQVEIVLQKSYLLDVGYLDYRMIILNSIRRQLGLKES